MKDLSNLVKATRLSKGLNKSQLAREAGVSSRTIDRAESGEKINEVTQHKIANALKVSVVELFPEAAGS
jgi:transcriptional regulator with XRE-family HTH domain